MIKNYHQFISEKLNVRYFERQLKRLFDGEEEDEIGARLMREHLSNLRIDFAHKVKGLSNYFDSYYSSLASGGGDPEKDFDKLQQVMDYSGYTIDIIKKLFDSRVSKFISQDFQDFITNNRLNDINGYVDTYLYLLNEKIDLGYEVSLGGPGWTDFQRDSEEWLIKYSYGYHNTLYGKLLLDSLKLTSELFIETAVSEIKAYLNIHLGSDLNYRICSHFDIKDNLRFVIAPYITHDDDGCFIFYERMWEDFKEKNKSHRSIPDKEWNDFITPDLFKESVLNSFKQFKFEIKDTDEYIYVYSPELVNPKQ